MSLYAGHIPTTCFQKALLAAGSATISILNPRRGDMVATMGETTGANTLKVIRKRMLSSEEGRRIINEQPEFTDASIQRERLRQLPDQTLGREYARFLDRLQTSPEERPAVQFIDDVELAYVMRRYRQTHDIYHIVLNQPTNILGEVVVKWFEAVQLGLPMAITGGLFGAARLNYQQRLRYTQELLPWIVRSARESNLLMSVYWEHHWETQLDKLRENLNIQLLQPSPSPADSSSTTSSQRK